jgi:nicotinamide-nucleotide amidase
MFTSHILTKAETVLALYDRAGLSVMTAESCTGGLVAACLTSIAGSSHVFERGVVTYANQAKVDLLGVAEGLIASHGAVSEPVARAMAEGGVARSPADVAVAVTGIAGPGGGTLTKPVGLVHVAATREGGETHHVRYEFEGDREEVRMQAVAAALDALALVAGQTP